MVKLTHSLWLIMCGCDVSVHSKQICNLIYFFWTPETKNSICNVVFHRVLIHRGFVTVLGIFLFICLHIKSTLKSENEYAYLIIVYI